MKNLFALYVLSGFTTTCFGQGLINFYNTPSTLISDAASGPAVPITGGVGSWYFALLTSPVGADNFSFAGVYGTNNTTAGMFTGGAGIAVPSWTAGTARDFVVFGWNLGAGVTYNPSWLKPNLSDGSNDPFIFGFSVIGTGIAGGVTGSGTAPTLNIFGGPTGIQSGFSMGSPVPEPSSIALGGLGAVLLMPRFRRTRAQ